MIMLIEILLTIRAWRKGWKGYALLPIAIGMSVSFLIGAAVGASGGTIENILPLCVLIELMMIISLIVMAVRGPSCVEKTQEAEVADLTTKVAA
jgi:hypothetical protein